MCKLKKNLTLLPSTYGLYKTKIYAWNSCTCNTKNALAYLLTAETYYCFYVHLSLKRFTGIWTLFESLTQFSEWGTEELFQAQTHIFGHDKGILSRCHSVFSIPYSGSLRHPTSPSVLGICSASDTQVSPLPFPCFMPLHPAEGLACQLSVLPSWLSQLFPVPGLTSPLAP